MRAEPTPPVNPNQTLCAPTDAETKRSNKRQLNSQQIGQVHIRLAECFLRINQLNRARQEARRFDHYRRKKDTDNHGNSNNDISTNDKVDTNANNGDKDVYKSHKTDCGNADKAEKNENKNQLFEQNCGKFDFFELMARIEEKSGNLELAENYYIEVSF